MLRNSEPPLTVAGLQAVQAPPGIDATLDTGWTVFAETVSCTEADDFAVPTRNAQPKHRHLMLGWKARPAVVVMTIKVFKGSFCGYQACFRSVRCVGIGDRDPAW
jgi:hypothetical protein